MSNVKYQMSNVRCHMSNVKFQMSNVRCKKFQMPNCKQNAIEEYHAMSYQCQMSNVKCQISNVKCQMSHVKYQMSNVRCTKIPNVKL